MTEQNCPCGTCVTCDCCPNPLTDEDGLSWGRRRNITRAATLTRRSFRRFSLAFIRKGSTSSVPHAFRTRHATPSRSWGTTPSGDHGRSSSARVPPFPEPSRTNRPPLSISLPTPQGRRDWYSMSPCAARIAAVAFCVFHPATRWFFDVESPPRPRVAQRNSLAPLVPSR